MGNKDLLEKPILFFFFPSFVFIGIELIYNVVLVSAVQQSESVLYLFFFRFFSHIGHYRVESPVLQSRSLLVLYFTYTCVHASQEIHITFELCRK